MASFDSTKESLVDVLKDITIGKIQLPDFQRGWIWDDDHIKDLLVSIGRSFPIGAVMLLEAGGNIRFETRPVEGLENRLAAVQPEKLILDGQQRLTTLTQAIALSAPVNTRTSKGKPIRRFYYFDIQQALENPRALDEAIVAVDENKQIRTNFGRDIALDLSTTELECRHLHFPCNRIMNSDEWEMKLYEVSPDEYPLYMQFRQQVIDAFRSYMIPIIELKKETSKEAVCLVFEKVNTGGVQLSVFELITAIYAADNYNLRDDWFGSTIRNVEGRKERLEETGMLQGTEPTEFLQAVTLLHTYQRRQEDLQSGKTGRKVRPVSAKRADVVDLPLAAWVRWADDVEAGFKLAARFLQKEGFYNRRELPYRTQIVPLAAVMTHLRDRWREPQVYDKLVRWFWCGVLGELYGGAVETRIANDVEELFDWIEGDGTLPRTVRDASFQPERLHTLRSRASAAYKGLNVLIIREGARDWYWKASIQELDSEEINLDIHHVFPRNWCQEHGLNREVYDSILNKTPLSYKANRTIGGDAPSVYLRKLQELEHIGLSGAQMDELVASHAIDPSTLRADDFEGFIQDRREKLIALIERALGKPVARVTEA